jgi:hypothetical protein
MYYKQFTKSISGADTTIRSYGYLIQSIDGNIFVDNEQTDFESLEEARKYIKNKHCSEAIETEIIEKQYEEISENRIANIIKEHHDIKVTDTLIESYLELASSKIFTVDPVVQEIRKLNKLDSLIENKVHYELQDGSIVAIDEQTQEQLNNLLAIHKDVVEYMRESKDNFFNVVNKIKE